MSDIMRENIGNRKYCRRARVLLSTSIFTRGRRVSSLQILVGTGLSRRHRLLLEEKEIRKEWNFCVGSMGVGSEFQAAFVPYTASSLLRVRRSLSTICSTRKVGTHVANRCVAQLGKNECPRDDGLIWGERTSTRSLDNVIDNGIESVWEVDAGVGGISGGSGPIDSDGRGGSGGEDADGNAYNLSPEVMLVFREIGRTPSSIPRDILEALLNGRADAAQLRRYFQIENFVLIGKFATQWKGLRNRLLMNTRFWMVVSVELAIGFATKTFAEVKTRGDKFWKEFDFYLSDIALELVGDFSLVWLLSPAVHFGPPAAAGSLGAFLSTIPKHALQSGNFNLLQRLFCVGYKGLQFGMVGFMASTIGHSATKALVEMRQKNRPEDTSDVHLASVMQNSLGWGYFMATSSSPRYQTVNAIEERVIDTVFKSNMAVATALTTALRLSNCFFGSFHWLHMAKYLGLQ